MSKVYKSLASRLDAWIKCVNSGNVEWEGKHMECIERTMTSAPSGSGIDNGTKFDTAKSEPNKLLFHTAYHHMNQNGMYDGWTEHTITVIPDLVQDFVLRISGVNRNQIKSYLYEMFTDWLEAEVDPMGHPL